MWAIGLGLCVMIGWLLWRVCRFMMPLLLSAIGVAFAEDVTDAVDVGDQEAGGAVYYSEL